MNRPCPSDCTTGFTAGKNQLCVLLGHAPDGDERSNQHPPEERVVENQNRTQRCRCTPPACRRHIPTFGVVERIGQRAGHMVLQMTVAEAGDRKHPAHGQGNQRLIESGIAGGVAMDDFMHQRPVQRSHDSSEQNPDQGIKPTARDGQCQPDSIASNNQCKCWPFNATEKPGEWQNL